MKIELFKGNDWIDLYIDGIKYYGGHSLPAQWALQYVSQALRLNPIGVNTMIITVRDCVYDDEFCTYTPLDGEEFPSDIGCAEMKDLLEL